MWYDGNSNVCKCGNSLRKMSSATPSEAMIGVKPCVSNALIMGIQRVA